jgi:hypothetical protein
MVNQNPKKDSSPTYPEPAEQEDRRQRSHHRVEIRNLELCHCRCSYIAGKSCGQEYACYIPS